jgi:peptide/nickel transport system substrate-binding protein
MTRSDSTARLPFEVTRRDFARLLALGTAAGAATLGGGRVLAQTPVAGDRPAITIGVQSMPDSLDPAVAGGSVVGARTLYSIYDFILECDYLGGDAPGLGSEIVPSLAESWTQIDDLTTEFVLRSGVTFHDGSPLTANDVKYTVDRIIAPDADPTLQGMLSAFATIEAVEVVDDLTFRIVTKAPDPALLQGLTYGSFWTVPQAHVERVGNEAFGLMPVGSGPYKVVEFVPGDKLVMEAHAGYWGSPAAFSTVTIRVIPETATRIAGVQSNELQLITTVPPDQMVQLESDSNLATSSIPIANCHIYFFNTTHPVVSNKLVRQGLNKGFDRRAIIDSLWHGKADYMQSFQLERWGDFFNPDRDPYAYDPDAASALLEEGGYNGEEIVYTSINGYYLLGVEVAQVIVASWQALGVNARLEIVEAWSADPATTMIHTWSNSLAPNDPAVTYWKWWSPQGTPQAQGFWTPEDPRFNGELADTLTGSMDHAARVEAFQAMLDIWDDEAPAGILYNQHETYVQRGNVGWQPYTIYGMDLREKAIRRG